MWPIFASMSVCFLIVFSSIWTSFCNAHLAFLKARTRSVWTTSYTSPTLMLFNWRYKAQIACHNQFFLPVSQLKVFPFFLKVQSMVSCVQWHAFQFPAQNALLSGLIDRPFHIICLFRQNPSGGQFFSFFFFTTDFRCFFFSFFFFLK